MSAPGDAARRSREVAVGFWMLALMLAACSRSGLEVSPLDDGEIDGGEVDAGEVHDAGSMDAGSRADVGTVDAGMPPVLPRFVQVAVGREHSCALSDGAEVWCWGSDLYGELGQGVEHRHECGTSSWRAPCRGWAEPVPDLEGARTIAAGQRRTAALMADGQVRCHGSCPITLPGLPRLVHMSLSRRGLFGVDEAGAVWWSRFWLAAEPIDGVESAAEVAAGDRHVCVLHRDGAVTCWGANLHGQLGVPRTDACADECGPVSVPLPGPAIEVVAGEAQTCARLVDSRVLCWGYVGSRVDVLPEPVPELAGSTSLAVGAAGIACGSASDGELHCVLPSSLRFDPAPLGPASELSFSNDWLYTDRFWRYIPHESRDGWIYSDVDEARLVGRGTHACALRSDGSIACLGANYAGQLGRGGWGAGLHPRAPILSARPADVPPIPPPDDGGDPLWRRLAAMPEFCPLQVARDPARAVTLRTEACAFGPPSCRAIVAPGFSFWGGGPDRERGLLLLRSLTSSPPVPEERVITAIASTQLDVLVAWAGPSLQFWCDTNPGAPRCGPGVDYTYSCRIGGVALGEDHVALSLWAAPWPARVLRAPIAEAGSTSVPTSLTPWSSLAVAVSRSAVAFENSGVPMTENGRTVVSAPSFAGHLNSRRGLLSFGRDLLWWESPGALIAGGLDRTAARLIPGVVLAFGTDERDLVWFEPTPAGPLAIWTSPHTLDPDSLVPRRVGSTATPLGALSTSLAVGAGRVAWLSRAPLEAARVIVLDLADGSRRRFDVPYHIDAGHGQLTAPLFLTETELFVPTASVRGGEGNRVYRVQIHELPIDLAGP